MTEKRTYADRAEYLKKAAARRRRIFRTIAIRYKGRRCVFCGYIKCQNALEFHHANPQTKKCGISMRSITKSWPRVRKELDKHILVCANCHREIHEGINRLPP